MLYCERFKGIVMFSMDALSVAARVGIGDLADPRLPQSHSQTNIM